MRTLLSGLAVFGACSAVRRRLDRPGRKDAAYFGGHVKLTRLWNDGAAFGLRICPEVLPVLSAAVLGAVWGKRKEYPVAVGLALGGGISNLAERLQRGKVYDYIQFPKAPGKCKEYVFNLADFAILAGGAILAAKGKKLK